jgi:hypothetical protein
MKDEIMKKAIADYFKNASFKLVPSDESSVEIEIEPKESKDEIGDMEEEKSLPQKLMKGMK